MEGEAVPCRYKIRYKKSVIFTDCKKSVHQHLLLDLTSAWLQDKVHGREEADILL